MATQHEEESGSGQHGEGAVSGGEEGSCLPLDEEFHGICHPVGLASVSGSFGLREGMQDEPEPKKGVVDTGLGKQSPHWLQEVPWAEVSCTLLWPWHCQDGATECGREADREQVLLLRYVVCSGILRERDRDVAR